MGEGFAQKNLRFDIRYLPPYTLWKAVKPGYHDTFVHTTAVGAA
jgi:hypothetical protein